MKPEKIYALIMLERERQNAQWGGKKWDARHSNSSWITIIRKHLAKLDVASKRHHGKYIIKSRLIVIAALCVAALETMEDENENKKDK